MDMLESILSQVRPGSLRTNMPMTDALLVSYLAPLINSIPRQVPPQDKTVFAVASSYYKSVTGQRPANVSIDGVLDGIAYHNARIPAQRSVVKNQRLAAHVQEVALVAEVYRQRFGNSSLMRTASSLADLQSILLLHYLGISSNDSKRPEIVFKREMEQRKQRNDTYQTHERRFQTIRPAPARTYSRTMRSFEAPRVPTDQAPTHVPSHPYQSTQGRSYKTLLATLGLMVFFSASFLYLKNNEPSPVQATVVAQKSIEKLAYSPTSKPQVLSSDSYDFTRFNAALTSNDLPYLIDVHKQCKQLLRNSYHLPRQVQQQFRNYEQRFDRIISQKAEDQLQHVLGLQDQAIAAYRIKELDKARSLSNKASKLTITFRNMNLFSKQYLGNQYKAR